jgi:hypothetical protein
MLPWGSTVCPPAPRIGRAGVKLEMEICKVEKTYMLIKLTAVSPQMRMQ